MTFALIYHDIAPADRVDEYGFPGPAAARYKLTPEGFERHLDALAGTGLAVGLLARRPQAALTFDDGGASALQAADALERRGWAGHFYITTGRIGTRGFLSTAGVRELAQRGHEVGSHSHSHPTYMGTLSRSALADEWRRSREILGGVLGSPPPTAAVPGGFLSGDVIAEAAKAGYVRLMTSQPTARTREHGGMTVYGRFTVWAGTAPERAAAYARGDVRARVALWLAWEAKTASKRLSPRAYEKLRQTRARLATAARRR